MLRDLDERTRWASTSSAPTLWRTADDALGEPGVRRSVLRLMKYARARNLWQRFVGWLPELGAVVRGPRGAVLFQAMWSYFPA